MSDVISKKDAVTEVRKACDQFSDLYFHVAKTLYLRFGEEETKAILEEAVASRAEERGKKLRETAEKLNLESTIENWYTITDIPFLGWDPSYGRFVCPFSESWVKRFDDYPWFKDIASLYCDVNDTTVHEYYTGHRETQKITKNVLWGDDSCDRVFFPFTEKESQE